MSKNRDLANYGTAALEDAEVSATAGSVVKRDASGNLETADKIIHSGDTDTAIRFPAADTVTVETDGAERVRVDSTGNVGIGLTNPASVAGKLAVNGNIAVSNGNYALFWNSANSGLAAIQGVDTNALRFVRGEAGTESMRIDASGNVGIGTGAATIAAGLHVVKGTDGIPAAGANTAAACFGNFNSANAYGLVMGAIGATGNGYISAQRTDGTAVTYNLLLQPNGGNVGIGTSSPTSLLHAQKTGTADIAIVAAGSVDFRASSLASGNEVRLAKSGNDGPITFWNDGAERMRIDSSGNVGIGTSTPSRKLQAVVDGGADRDMFLFGVSGLSNGVYWAWVNSTSTMNFRVASLPTTASAANAYLDGSADNQLYRSTSSIRYKKDIEDIDAEHSENALNLRPVWYRSKADGDNSKWSWYGLIAEEVAEIDPRLVHWSYADDSYEVEEVDGVIKKTPKPDAEMIPDGVQYERLSVLLLDLVKKQSAQIKALEARIEALEG
jgi:hypothetical protein